MSIKVKIYGTWSIPKELAYQYKVFQILNNLDPEAVKEYQMEIADQLYYELRLKGEE